MNLKVTIVLFLLFVSSKLSAQQLGSARVQHAKNSTVRILINGQPSGTGFIVSEQCNIITCWHVVAPAATLPNAVITAQLNSGEVVTLNVFNFFTGQGNREAVGYDACIFVPSIPPKSKFEFLKVGNFNNAQEGDQVFTVGFPLVVKQPIVSVGMLSTKWVEVNQLITNGQRDSISRNVAWLDLTMNRGNSGGAIIKVGNTPNEDEVIGIATFILNPYGPVADQLLGAVSNNQGDVAINGISQTQVTKLYASAIANNSVGVSGCISINHLLDLARKGNLIR